MRIFFAFAFLVVSLVVILPVGSTRFEERFVSDKIFVSLPETMNISRQPAIGKEQSNWQSAAPSVGNRQFFNLQSNGQALYAQHCARCHGGDGKSKTALGKNFKAPDLTTSRVQARSNTRFTSSIKKGRGNMPGFSKKLSAQDIVALIAYVRSFKK
jgi:mono/diheme cytochrome c family protein